MGEEGSSDWAGNSSDDVELEYRVWPRENVGVTGEVRSEQEEFCVWKAQGISVEDALSRFLRFSTSLGSNNGFSWGDMSWLLWWFGFVVVVDDL
jgi:hypothetical protein